MRDNDRLIYSTGPLWRGPEMVLLNAAAQQALASAFSSVDSNSPIPANAACDYFWILGGLLHPGQGKRTVEAVVLKCEAPTTGSCTIELTDSYG